MAQREQWGSRAGFVLAAVGSAIGLGNIWRFPYMAYENGGGAFLIPYIFALLTAGIPFMILEFGLGHKFRGSAPKVFRALGAKWEWLGWMQVLVALIISIYYVAVIGWTINYTGFALDQSWGADPKAFFFGDYLGLTSSPLELGGIRWPILAACTLAWAITWLAITSGVRKGIERACKILIPLLFLLVLVLIVRVVNLPGALDGLNYLFNPDFSKLADFSVWADAYGQIFFSLSIGFSIMLAYSSYLPKDSDINNNAAITVFINCGFSMLAGVMIFSVLGNMAPRNRTGCLGRGRSWRGTGLHHHSGSHQHHARPRIRGHTLLHLPDHGRRQFPHIHRGSGLRLVHRQVRHEPQTDRHPDLRLRLCHDRDLHHRRRIAHPGHR